MGAPNCSHPAGYETGCRACHSSEVDQLRADLAAANERAEKAEADLQASIALSCERRDQIHRQRARIDREIQARKKAEAEVAALRSRGPARSGEGGACRGT